MIGTEIDAATDMDAGEFDINRCQMLDLCRVRINNFYGHTGPSVPLWNRLFFPVFCIPGSARPSMPGDDFDQIKMGLSQQRGTALDEPRPFTDQLRSRECAETALGHGKLIALQPRINDIGDGVKSSILQSQLIRNQLHKSINTLDLVSPGINCAGRR